VLSEVLCRLLRIPLKLHSRSLREAAVREDVTDHQPAQKGVPMRR
jgi:hypothetical protein